MPGMIPDGLAGTLTAFGMSRYGPLESFGLQEAQPREMCIPRANLATEETLLDEGDSASGFCVWGPCLVGVWLGFGVACVPFPLIMLCFLSLH